MIKCPSCGKTRISGIATIRVPCSARERLFIEQGEPELVGLEMECRCGHKWKVREKTINRIKNVSNT